MNLKPYPEYKDSGVEWIGEIPKGWRVSKIKDYLDFQIGGTPSTGKEDYFEGENIWVSIADLNNKKTIVNSVKKISDDAIINSNVKKVKKGSLLFSFKLSVGLTAFAGCELYTNEAIASFLPNKHVNLNFLKYVLQKDFENNAFENIYGAKLFNTDLLRFARYVLPLNLKEQIQIADFLDKKTSEIDLTIEKDTHLIELLKEKRTALINHVVTKGLDPTVRMKDSGVEWIGEIPEDWEVLPLFALFKERKVKNIRNRETNVLSLSYGKIIRRNVETNFGLLPESFETYNIVEPDCIVLRLTDLQNDKKSLRTGLVKEKGIITSAYLSLEKRKELDVKYVHYLLHAYDLVKVFYSLGGGVRQSMRYEDMKKMPILYPPINEQTKISNYIDKKTEKLDDFILKIGKHIKLLEEYKKSLIHHVVTGKVDVREVAV